jgi:hypothetical protein
VVKKPDGNKPLGRPNRRWEDNIKMDLQEMSWDGTGWIYLAQDRGQVVGNCVCGNEHSSSIKFGKYLD